MYLVFIVQRNDAFNPSYNIFEVVSWRREINMYNETNVPTKS